MVLTATDTPRAFERPHLGLAQARAGNTVAVDKLSSVSRLGLTAAAVEDLGRLIFTHGLPADTMARVRRSIAPP
jgi:hypothetical protein